jgi:hypothetical protein
MSTTKTSKVVKCLFTNEWKNPSGGMTYYHEVTLENGDTGSIGSMQKYSPKFTEGVTITYTLDSTGKMKIDNSSSEQAQQKKPASNNYSSQNYNRPAKQDQFLGYAWSYAKDMVVAGKTSEDFEEVMKIAHMIYDEIGNMLNK